MHIPDELKDIDKLREMIANMLDQDSLCGEVNNCDDIVKCGECVLNFRHNERESQVKDTVIQLLIDNKIITKGQALRLTLDSN